VKTAWLVTWEWVGEHAERKDKVASILNYRLSGKTVADYMEKLYVDSEFSFNERLEYAKSKYTPYPARFDMLELDGNKAHWEGRIHCGHNPFLYGRLVQNIHVETNADGSERLEWDEIPRPRRDTKYTTP